MAGNYSRDTKRKYTGTRTQKSAFEPLLEQTAVGLTMDRRILFHLICLDVERDGELNEGGSIST